MNKKQLISNLKKAIGNRQHHVVATEYGISPTTLSNILNGKAIPTQTRVVAAIEKIIMEGSE